MATTVLTETLPRTSCCARVVRLIPETLQTSAVLASGAMLCSQRWNALAERVMADSLQNGWCGQFYRAVPAAGRDADFAQGPHSSIVDGRARWSVHPPSPDQRVLLCPAAPAAPRPGFWRLCRPSKAVRAAAKGRIDDCNPCCQGHLGRPRPPHALFRALAHGGP